MMMTAKSIVDDQRRIVVEALLAAQQHGLRAGLEELDRLAMGVVPAEHAHLRRRFSVAFEMLSRATAIDDDAMLH
jgi:hypothetical protein